MPVQATCGCCGVYLKPLNLSTIWASRSVICDECGPGVIIRCHCDRASCYPAKPDWIANFVVTLSFLALWSAESRTASLRLTADLMNAMTSSGASRFNAPALTACTQTCVDEDANEHPKLVSQIRSWP